MWHAEMLSIQNLCTVHGSVLWSIAIAWKVDVLSHPWCNEIWVIYMLNSDVEGTWKKKKLVNFCCIYNVELRCNWALGLTMSVCVGVCARACADLHVWLADGFFWSLGQIVLPLQMLYKGCFHSEALIGIYPAVHHIFPPPCVGSQGNRMVFTSLSVFFFFSFCCLSFVLSLFHFLSLALSLCLSHSYESQLPGTLLQHSSFVTPFPLFSQPERRDDIYPLVVKPLCGQ